MIRVGRCVYKNGKRTDPSYPDFTPIICLTKSTAYGSLGPYVLKDNKRRIMENIYQFSKVYEKVPKSVQRYSRYDQRIIWDWPAETHCVKKDTYINKLELTPEYLRWRKAGMNAADPIRYPVGFKDRHKCLFSLKEDPNGNIDPTPLNYIEGRKQIYLPVYTTLVKKQKQFLELRMRLENGENLLIIEVDGPHQESLNYYMKKYNVEEDFIENSTMLSNDDNLNIMLNDEKHAFGHGYCLAAALLDIELS